MSQAQATAPSDRLPWLDDEPGTPRSPLNRRQPIAILAAAAILGVAGGAYWLGTHSRLQTQPEEQPRARSATVTWPQRSASEPQQPQVALAPEPQVEIAPQRELSLSAPRVRRYEEVPAAAARRRVETNETPRVAAPKSPAASAPSVSTAPAVTRTAPLTAWPAWQSAGASGRIVRIGAFGTRQQAKLGWRSMVLSYPAVAHLKAMVVESRNSRGRPFYRFQLGTTSQAHSEVLCQRMERIHLSCAVVGLAWKPGGVER